jgi:uncharacterized protein YndB with AHSA1/START domain
MRHGTFTTIDDRPAVRFTTDLAHPADRVWQAITSPDALRTWFPARVSYRPRVGAPITFTDDPTLPTTSGTVLAYDAPSLFAFGWGDDELWFEVSESSPSEGSSASGGARLTLTDILDLSDAAARNAAGWEVCLDALERHLDGLVHVGDGPHTTHSRQEWRDYYEAYVAEGMPTGAPIPGDDATDDESDA